MTVRRARHRVPHRTRRRPAAVVVVVVLLVVTAAVTTAVVVATIRTDPATGPRTWYVSADGDGSTGRSWATAWSEPDEIAWSQIRAGDQIVLDGGPDRCGSDVDVSSIPTLGRNCGMVYRSGLTVGASGGPGKPITIRVSGATGRNGTALLSGGRTTPLPYCNQPDYQPGGLARPAGITVTDRSYVRIDGSHRSGLMVYGAERGVDLAADENRYVTLRNLEIFDNGTVARWAHGVRTDGEGVAVGGNHITIERSLIHDNGQDAVQDGDTGAPGIGHAPIHDLRITDSWLYERRASPRYPGFGFNSGAQDVPEQDCTHVDGVQIFAGGLHQQQMTFAHDVFGPYLAQGVYLGDTDTTSVDGVVVLDALFLNVLDHSIIGDNVAADPTTPAGWRIDHVTSYQTAVPAPGLRTHGKVDLAGTGHALTNSIFVNGYFATDSAFATGRGNLWWGGDPVVGGTRVDPLFAGELPTTAVVSFPTLTALDLTPTCASCADAGSSLHDVGDLLRRIDNLNRGQR